MSLSEQQLKEFKSKGFIVLKSFFDAPSINRVSGIVDDLRDKTPEEIQEAKYYETSPTTGQDVLLRIEHVLGDYNSELTNLINTLKVNVCLTQLLGEPAFLFKEKINYKLPGCRPDKLHQDQVAGWNTYGDFFITMAIVVDANRKDNQALNFMNSGNYKRALMTDEWKTYAPNTLKAARTDVSFRV